MKALGSTGSLAADEQRANPAFGAGVCCLLVSGICWQDQQLVLPEPPDNVAWEAQVTKTSWSD